MTEWCTSFLYDYKFERVWKDPEGCIERLKNYKAVLSPDFSMYIQMNPVMQLTIHSEIVTAEHILPQKD